MFLLNAEQSRELDRLAMRELGLSEAALMEAAGLSAVQAMEREFGDLAGRRVALVCGKGRNGGDALVAARHLLNQGCVVVACVAAKKEELGAPAAAQAGVLEKLGLQLAYINEESDLGLAKGLLAGADLIVDGLFGTGFKGALTGLPAALLVAANAAGKPITALDLPSGVDADSGAVRGAAAYAALTVTFSHPKRGLFQEPGRSYCGKLVCSDIGIPASLLLKLKGLAELPEAAGLRSLLPARHPQAHKKSAGSLLVVAGSAGYPGAAILCVRAAFRSGASFIHLMAPEAVLPLLQAALPEAVCHRSDEGLALELSKECGAAVVGPGLDRGEAAQRLARNLFEKLERPALIDADALYALSKGFLSPAGPRLLTPHEGEMARLAGGELPADRHEAALGYASAKQVNLLLKGPGTLLASPEGRLSVNPTGNAALATAGSGDVLAGLCGALMAQGLAPFDAGRLGAWLQGAACELWCAERGSVGMTASDLAERLPAAFAHLRGKA